MDEDGDGARLGAVEPRDGGGRCWSPTSSRPITDGAPSAWKNLGPEGEAAAAVEYAGVTGDGVAGLPASLAWKNMGAVLVAAAAAVAWERRLGVPFWMAGAKLRLLAALDGRAT